jgi:general L-amino acid transport system substrate-binding protein
MRMFAVASLLSATLAAMGALSQAQAQGTKTLDTIKARGQLSCGASQGVAGFSAPDDKGRWTGLDVDFCRAVAAAVFGDPDKVSFKPLSAKERLTALQSGEVDLLSRTTTWTMTRDSAMGLSFVGTMFYDGQSFLVRKSLNIKTPTDLKGATICTTAGTTSELNLADYFRTRNIDYKPLVFEKNDEVISAYDSGRCDAWSTDATGLASERLKLKSPDDHLVLADVISKEPLAPVVRQGDSQWFTIVKWTYFALLNTEELGVTKANVDQMAASTNPEIKRLLGKEGDFGKGIGLDNDWVVKIVKAVGNYGEIFDRNVGKDSRLKFDRGLNRLWTQGGLMYAPPIR